MRLVARAENSAGERVKIGLHLKRLSFTYVPADTLSADERLSLNEQGLLPFLEIDGKVIPQSAAILDYLEETYPENPLLPEDPVVRAQSRAFGAYIAAEMQAIMVERVRHFLKTDLGADNDGIHRWVHHWFDVGFATLEASLARRSVEWPFCFGERPGWADLHLIPQISAARRFGFDLSGCPRLVSVEQRCVGLEAFRLSRPDAQPDFKRKSG